METLENGVKYVQSYKIQSYEICSKNTPRRRHLFLVFSLLILSMYLFAGDS